MNLKRAPEGHIFILELFNKTLLDIVLIIPKLSESYKNYFTHWKPLGIYFNHDYHLIYVPASQSLKMATKQSL